MNELHVPRFSRYGLVAEGARVSPHQNTRGHVRIRSEEMIFEKIAKGCSTVEGFGVSVLFGPYCRVETGNYMYLTLDNVAYVPEDGYNMCSFRVVAMKG